MFHGAGKHSLFYVSENFSYRLYLKELSIPSASHVGTSYITWVQHISQSDEAPYLPMTIVGLRWKTSGQGENLNDLESRSRCFQFFHQKFERLGNLVCSDATSAFTHPRELSRGQSQSCSVKGLPISGLPLEIKVKRMREISRKQSIFIPAS